MPWWGWIIFGVLLFGTELMIVELEFYLMVVGTAAIIVGIVDLTGIMWQPWAELLTFATLALLSVYLLRNRVFQRGGR